MSTDHDDELGRLKAQLAAERAALESERAQLSAQRAALEESRRIVDRKAAQSTHDTPAVRRASAGSPAPARAVTPRWRESDSGAWTFSVSAALTRGEDRLARLNWPDGWLVITGLEVADRTRTREIDALVIAPGGLLTVEQKDTSAQGTLEFSLNGPPVADGVEVPRLEGALRQARLPAQMISSLLRDGAVKAGYVQAALSVHGRVRIRATQIGGVNLTTTAQLPALAAGLLRVRDEEDLMSSGAALGVLGSLGVPLGGLPPLGQLGFIDHDW